MELRAVRGRAMVAGVPLSSEVPGGRLWGLPPDLVDALQEWARVAALGSPTGADATDGADGTDGTDGVTVSRRGRHLAAWLSVVLGAPVDYCDPLSGHRIALRGVTRTPHPPPVPTVRRAAPEPPPGDTPPATPGAGTAAVTASGGEPTPWGSGLALSTLTAGLVLLANLALAAPMITGLGVLGLLIDVVVVAGLVPALWLNRTAPTWRWTVYGTFAGMAMALPALAVQTLS